MNIVVKRKPLQAERLSFKEYRNLILLSFSCLVQDLKCGATSELLLNIRNDTHSDIHVTLDNCGHKGAVAFVHRLTLSCDKVTDIFDRLEVVVKLDTGLGTELCLQHAGRRTDVDVRRKVFSNSIFYLINLLYP